MTTTTQGSAFRRLRDSSAGYLVDPGILRPDICTLLCKSFFHEDSLLLFIVGERSTEISYDSFAAEWKNDGHENPLHETEILFKNRKSSYVQRSSNSIKDFEHYSVKLFGTFSIDRHYSAENFERTNCEITRRNFDERCIHRSKLSSNRQQSSR